MNEKMLPYYTVLGRVMSNWDRLESGCMHVFTCLLQSPAADALYLSVRSFEARLSLTKVVIAKLAKEDAQKRGLVLLEGVLNLSRQRNAVVHGQWIGGVSRNDYVVRFGLPEDWNQAAEVLRAYQTKNPSFQKKFHKHLYNLARLEKLADDIDALVAPVFAFGTAAEQALSC